MMQQPWRLGSGGESLVRFKSLLSQPELLRLQRLLTSPRVEQALSPSTLFDNLSQSNRKCRVAWLERAATAADGDPVAPEWLHRALRRAALHCWELFGDCLCPVGADTEGRWTPAYEPVQYSVYMQGEHYAGWHTDSEEPEVDPSDARSISIVLMVSDSASYAGGNFQAQVRGKRSRARPCGTHSAEVPLKAGDAVGFPAKYLQHRVSQVDSCIMHVLN